MKAKKLPSTKGIFKGVCYLCNRAGTVRTLLYRKGRERKRRRADICYECASDNFAEPNVRYVYKGDEVMKLESLLKQVLEEIYQVKKLLSGKVQETAFKVEPEKKISKKSEQQRQVVKVSDTVIRQAIEGAGYSIIDKASYSQVQRNSDKVAILVGAKVVVFDKELGGWKKKLVGSSAEIVSALKAINPPKLKAFGGEKKVVKNKVAKKKVGKGKVAKNKVVKKGCRA